MQCRTHPERNGVNTCHQCGDWLCEECTVEINGRIFCRKCLAQLAGAPAPEPRHAAPPPASPYPPHVHFRALAPRGRHVSGLILGLLTIFLPIPGVNYMYEGLIKRGLAAMGGFFFLIFAMSTFVYTPQFGFLFAAGTAIYWLACFFDSLKIRRLINAGETVNDDIDDMIRFVKSNSRIIVGAVLVLAVIAIAGSVFSAFAHPLRKLLPFLVIGFGAYMLFGRPSRRGRKPEDSEPRDYHDTRGDDRQ